MGAIKELKIQRQNIFIMVSIGFFIASCQEKTESIALDAEKIEWNVESLNKKAIEHLDSSRLDHKLFKQDLDA